MRIGKKGFSLVEVVVSLAIMTIVGGAVGAFLIAGNNSYLRGNKELTLQEEAQLAANQMIDLIIDVERDIEFTPDQTGTAVKTDGTAATDASGNTIADAKVSELLLVNNENTYMIRWQGSASADYESANQVYLYEVKNNLDAEGNFESMGDIDAAEPALMAEHVSAFSVDTSQLADKRRVKLQMNFVYQDRSYDVDETIKLRNDLSRDSEGYEWIKSLSISPKNPTANQGDTLKFQYSLSGDPEAVAEAQKQGVTWTLTKADGTACTSTIDSRGTVSIASGEEVGNDVLLVTCTLKADASFTDSTYITVEKRLIDSISISPKSVEIVRGSNNTTQVFTCDLQGTTEAVAEGVDWELTYSDGTKITKSTLTPNGLKATLKVPIDEKVQKDLLYVTCSSKADDTKSARAVVTVSAIEGMYTIDLIRNYAYPYKYMDGSVEKIGWSVDLECMTSWADYLNGYPIITWSVVGNSNGYSFEDTSPASQYKQALRCSYHVGPDCQVTVRATVQLSATEFDYKDITIDIPPLQTVESSKEPYIDGEQFVLFRNGTIICELENYDGDYDDITWVIEDAVAKGLAEENPTLDAKGAPAGMGQRVGFSKTLDSKGLGDDDGTLVPKSVTGFEEDCRASTTDLYPTATGKKVSVWAKWYIDWQKEYQLELVAYEHYGDKDREKEIARTYLLIPECQFYFPGGRRYITLDKEKYKNKGGLYNDDEKIYVDVYGFVTGPGEYANRDNRYLNLDVTLEGLDPNVQDSQSKVQLFHFDTRKELDEEGKEIKVPTHRIQLWIRYNDGNDTFFLKFNDSRLMSGENQRESRILTIFWK